MAKAIGHQATRTDSDPASAFSIAVSVVGLIVFVYAAYIVATGAVSVDWILLGLATTLAVGRTSIRIPRTDSTVSLDNAFIYLSVLLYGVWPSVVLAGVNAVLCALRDPARRRVAPFSAGAMSLSVFASSSIVALVLGSPDEVASDVRRLILAAESLALVHYLLNSGLNSIVAALRNGSGLLRTWRESFLWTWMSYFAGAVAAALIFKLITVISFYGFIVAVPILAIIFLTYKNYLEKVQASIRHVEEMTDLHLRTIEALAIAIDAKDEVTHDHVHRVQIYAAGLARLFGLSDFEIEALKAGALLHDIGKLAVPDYILNKPDKLTTAEFDRMKLHTVVGAEILSRVTFPYPVVPVVRHHHERWDGRGYPDGLSGEQIPITARILSVVDCFDAVREDRQYRKAMTREQAIALIRSGSGTMYDPEVVRLFLEHLPKFEAEIARQKKAISVQGATLAVKPKTSTQEKAGRQIVAFEPIRNAHREVTTLYEIAQTIGTSLDLRDMFAVFSSRLQDIVSYTTCVLYLQKPNSIDVEAVHVSGCNAERFKGASIILGSGITGWVVSNRQPMYNCDPQLDFDAAQLKIDSTYRTVIAVPLLRGDEVLGALTLYAELGTYSSDHLRLVEAVGKLAADAISNAISNEKSDSTPLLDPQTGLPNARALRLRFEQDADRARRYGDNFALLIMNIDCLASVSATVGERTPNHAVREMAGSLSRQFRTEDFLSRYAYEEFVALVQIDALEVRAVVHRIQQALDNRGPGIDGSGVFAGISIGWACFGADGESFDELLLSADRAMTADKLRRKALASISASINAA